MYNVILSNEKISVSKIGLGSKIAKRLNVRLGDHVEIILDDMHVLLETNINEKLDEYSVIINSNLAKLLNIENKVVKISKCKHSKRKTLNRVRIKLMNHCEKIPIDMVAYIKHELLGKPVRKNLIIPLTILSSESILAHVIEAEPDGMTALITRTTLIEFS